MNAEMESELTELDSKTDHLAVSKEANVDEAIPIGPRKGRITQAYKETMIMDILKILTLLKLETK